MVPFPSPRFLRLLLGGVFTGGYVVTRVILTPAHTGLFSRFTRAIITGGYVVTRAILTRVHIELFSRFTRAIVTGGYVVTRAILTPVHSRFSRFTRAFFNTHQ
jgi:hypothetical protein